MKPVGVPGDHRVDYAVLHVRQEPLVVGPDLAAVGTDVVVGVDLDDLPAATPGELAAFLLLPLDTEFRPRLVLTDAGIDPDPHRVASDRRRRLHSGPLPSFAIRWF